MVRALRRPSQSLLVLAILSACASQPERDQSGRFHDSAFNDHNRAPASMTPPTPSSDSQTTIDPLYMRTQADYNFSMGEAYSLEGNRQKAIESFKMTLVYDPESSLVRLRLASEYLKTGLISEAIEQANEAVSKDPKNVDAQMLLGGLYSTMKAYDKAVICYEKVLKLEPNNFEAPLYLGAVWSEQKQFDKAIKSFENLSKNSDYATPHLAWYYIGRVRLEQKEAKFQKAAEQAFRKALSIKPDHADSVIALASVLNKRNQEEKSIQLMATFQKEHGPNAHIAEILSQFYVEKSRYDEAYEQLEILESNSDDALSVKMKMALILIERKMYDLATAKLEDILKEAPESDKVRFYLGAVYEESKQDDKAIMHFRKIPAESQYFDEAVIHAAYLLKGRAKIDEAISCIEKGIAAKKDHPQMYAMYASLLDEKGDYQKAAKTLEGILVKFPDNAQLRFYYGTVFDRLGKHERVIEEMRKVIEIDPNHVQGLNYLAFTWAEKGQNLEEAEKLARRATELDPKDGYVLDTLGWIIFKKGKVGEAIRVLEAAHRYQPTVSVIAEHLGDAYMKSSMAKRAVEMYHKALQLETDVKKIEEIRSKITTADNQRLPSARSPASAIQP